MRLCQRISGLHLGLAFHTVFLATTLDLPPDISGGGPRSPI